MRRVHSTPMTTEEVKERAIRVLNSRMHTFGMSNVDVGEDRDFDGTYVYRVVVGVEERVPPQVLIDASDELQQLLRSEGEEHWIYLSTRRAGNVDPDEDAE